MLTKPAIPQLTEHLIRRRNSFVLHARYFRPTAALSRNDQMVVKKLSGG